jgi:hypothetical protein
MDSANLGADMEACFPAKGLSSAPDPFRVISEAKIFITELLSRPRSRARTDKLSLLVLLRTTVQVF